MNNINIDENILFSKIKEKFLVLTKKTKLNKESFDELYNDWEMCDFKVKNHFYVNTLCNFSSETNIYNWFNFYLRVCQNNIGIIFTDGIFDGKYALNKSKYLNFHTQNGEFVNIFKDFILKVHSYGTKIFFNIKPNAGRGVINYNKHYNYSAAFNKNYNDSNYLCKRISDGGLNEIIEVSKNLTLFSKEVGFDGIMIDATDFNILGEMNNSEFNKRKFGYYYGNKTFLNKLIIEINNISNKYPIILKITPYTFISKVYNDCSCEIDSLRKNINNNNLTILDYFIELVSIGVDGFVFDFGTYETEFLSNSNTYICDNLFFDFYKLVNEYFVLNNIKNKYNKNVYMFYKDNLKLNNEIISSIKNKTIHSIDITREYYANNNILKEIKTQKYFKRCIKCSICNDFACKFNKTICLINPLISGYSINKINQKHIKPIAVIGSGYSGLYAAITLAERGFVVDLYEQENIINPVGKKLNVFDCNIENKEIYIYFNSKVREFAKNNKINIYLNHKFSTKNNEQNSYESIIIATGFKERFLCITGAVLKNVKSIYDALNDNNEILSYKYIVILAKSELAIKLAIYLNSQNKNVTLIAPSFKIFNDMPNSKITYYAFILNKLKIKTYINSKIKKINEDSVDIIINNKTEQKNISSVILNLHSGIEYPYLPEAKNIDCDLFIYEPELYSNNKLYYDLVKAGYGGELFMVGNALEISSLKNDIYSAFFVANNI